MKYISYRLSGNSPIFVYKSPLVGDSSLRRVEHIINQILPNSYNPFIYKINDEFILIKEYKELYYVIFFDTNPYLYLDSEVEELSNISIKLKPKSLNLKTINNLLDDNSYDTMEMLIQAIIDSTYRDNPIYLSPKTDLSLLCLVLSLLPDSHLSSLTISLDYDTKIRFSADYNKGIYFSFKSNINNTIIEPKRYAYTIVDNLRVSLEDALSYKARIDKLIDQKKISIAEVCDLLNLIDGKLERISSIEKLNKALKNLDGMDYNASFIATIIFTNINKYEINSDILEAYKFIYANINGAHDYIIKMYFDNIDKFIPQNITNPLEFLVKIEANAPFLITDYIYYLISHDKLDSTIKEYENSFCFSYFLLDLICRWIKKDKLTIVPNKYLSHYLNHYLYEPEDEFLLVIKRIKLLNNEALLRLLRNSIVRLLRSHSELNRLGIDRLLLALKNLNILDTAHYLKKLYLMVDKYKLYDSLLELKRDDLAYYNKLEHELEKDNEGIAIIDSLNERALIMNDNITIEDLDSYYNDYYIDRRHLDNGSFINAIMSYLDKANSLNEAIDIYKRYYSKLANGFKNTLLSIRKINDYIYNYYEIIYKSPNEYIEILDEINLRLERGRIEANSYYSMLKLGEELKVGNYNLFKAIIGYRVFLGLKDKLAIFYKYYFDTLLDSYFTYIMDNIRLDNSLITSFNLCIGPFLNIPKAADSLIKYISNSEGLLFYYLLIATNSNIKPYQRILEKLLRSLRQKQLRLYFKDYLSYLASNELKDISLSARAVVFINDYIENNMNIIEKILLKLRHK